MLPRAPQDIIQQHFREGRALEAFEAVYANALHAGGHVPWDDRAPAPLLVEWAAAAALNGSGQRALVVGCGLGDDAEYLAGRGFDVTAFDLSATAIAMCRQRWPRSSVAYIAADLLAAPAAWAGAFDVVLESRTLQAMPWQYTAPAIRAISRFVAPGGALLVLCLAREPQEPKAGIPWPLSRDELALFEAQGLRVVAWDEQPAPVRRFRVHYGRESAT